MKRKSSPFNKQLHIFSGTVYPKLAEDIAGYLDVELGNIKLKKFSNGEIYARYMETIRGEDVFLVQSVSGDVNDALMELLIMVDAAKRASARRVTCVITHYGYARQDKKSAAREPITAKLVANLLEAAGCDSIITMDPHQGQIQGFFDIPVNHLTALGTLADYYKEKGLDNICVVSPDAGRAKAAKKLSDELGADFALMHKGRPAHNVAEITNVIGDVEGKNCIINDDMIDTAGTICAGMKVLKDKGAKAVYVCTTHPVFSGPAYERLEASVAEEIVACSTIPVDESHLQSGKIKIINVAPNFAKAINNVFNNESVSQLFDPDFAL
ncbi:MAG: ribose-phosphate pyrophosphokinase [Coriobacteriales bacterium]|nr:ribose-phosphate pyrophosphokinase [Coriobacteriales bacterium]